MSTQISWTDETWNPTTGCSKVSEGCRNCYAAQMAPRLAAMGQKGYTDLPWTATNAPENVFTHPDRLDKPLRWKKPRRVFVNSMSDLFHEQVSTYFIDRVFAVMALAPQHTFQILTKRPKRMAEYLASHDAGLRWALQIGNRTGERPEPGEVVEWNRHGLPNVWLGTSVEDQRAADKRIPHLLNTPAAVRFLSCEPLLGPVDLTTLETEEHWLDALTGIHRVAGLAPLGGGPEEARVNWVIAGGESGPGYREMDHEWARSLRDQCVAAGVPFFFKQSSGRHNEMSPYLDGESWHQFPEVAS